MSDADDTPTDVPLQDTEEDVDDELFVDDTSDVADDELFADDILDDTDASPDDADDADDPDDPDAPVPLDASEDGDDESDGQPAVDLGAIDEALEVDDPVELAGEEVDDLDTEDAIRDGEFVCSSCHMAKRASALADPDEMLCRDCV